MSGSERSERTKGIHLAQAGASSRRDKELDIDEEFPLVAGRGHLGG